jgi:YbgC/YbaW family acyl-CoA thioester hydrolase
MYKTHATRIRVRSYEVDVEGHVNNAVFVHYLEHGRTRAMEEFGIPFQAWLDRGLYIVVTRLDMRIHAPAFMGDELEIRVTPTDLQRVKGTFHQEILNLSRGNKAVTATVYGAIVDRQGKPVRIPEEFRKAFIAE